MARRATESSFILYIYLTSYSPLPLVLWVGPSSHGSAETSVEVCERGRATWRCEKRPVKPAIASCLVPLISNQYKCGTDVRMRYQSGPHLASWSVPHLAVPRTTNFGGATPSGVKALYLCDPKIAQAHTPVCT